MKYNRKNTGIIHPLKQYIDELATQNECELFSGKVKALVTIKIEGKGCMCYTHNDYGIKLWVKEIVCKKYNLEYETTTHLYDCRIWLDEDTEENRQLIKNLVIDSIKYQKEKNKKLIIRC